MPYSGLEDPPPRHSKPKATKITGCGRGGGLSRDSGQLPQRSCPNLPLLVLSMPVSLQTLKMGRACLPHCLSRASPVGAGLYGEGGPVAASSFFVFTSFFFCSPRPTSSSSDPWTSLQLWIIAQEDAKTMAWQRPQSLRDQLGPSSFDG